MAEMNKTILVLDDELETVELFSEMLLVCGFLVQACTNYHQAVHLIEKTPPDGILLDVMMPEKSGLELLEYIRECPKSAGIPVIVVSSKGLPGDVAAGMGAGADQYLTKPVSFLELKQAFQDALQAK
jgi:CheY-like chemotaxis protein